MMMMMMDDDHDNDGSNETNHSHGNLDNKNDNDNNYKECKKTYWPCLFNTNVPSNFHTGVNADGNRSGEQFSIMSRTEQFIRLYLTFVCTTYLQKELRESFWTIA